MAMLKKTFTTPYFVRALSSRPVPELPSCNFKPQKYVGPPQDQLMKWRQTHMNPVITAFYRKPVCIHQGHMQYLYDVEGNRYVDMLAGIATVIAGHCHPKINEAAVKAMEKMWHCSNVYAHPNVCEYLDKLTSKLPDPLKVCYFVNSGSEANDLALFMGRMYTGCMDTFVLRGAYHGMSLGAMGLTSTCAYRYNYPGSSLSIHKIVNPDPYKGPWGGRACRDSPVQTDRQCDCAPGQCKASEMYLAEVEDALTYCTPKGKMGPMFVESIQGYSGATQFPRDYVQNAFSRIRERGGVCVSDEVQTGFGRTGSHYWGFQGHNVVPDIVVMAKGIGNGFPMAAVVTTPEIASVMKDSAHFNTFGGNPVASAIGSAVLDVIDEDGLQENADKLGTHFLLELAKLRDEFEVVGDVRGKGFMIGLELVSDKKGKKPLAADQILDIFEDLKDMRVLCGRGGFAGHVLRFKPPMCVNKDDVDYTVACMRIALENHRDNQARRK